MAQTVNRPDSRELKRRSENISSALEGLYTIDRSTSKTERKIRDAVEKLEERQVRTMLASMDVEELNRDKRGIRVTALRAAGIKNLEQVYTRSRGALERIPGIGEQSARAIYLSVRSIADMTRSNMSLKLSLEDNSEEFATLLTPLYMYVLTDPARKEGMKLLEEYGDVAEDAVSHAKTAKSTLGWLFSSAASKEEAARAASELEALESSGFPEEARRAYEAYQAVKQPTAEEARKAFETRGADFAVALEQLGTNVTGESGWSGVPAELAEQIMNRSIDLRYLKATLRSYQDFGTKYILTQKRTLLGDEMGLGKTMQAIAAMAALKAEGGEKFLVVCPASVLVNWCREVAQHSELEVDEIHGSDKSEELQRWIRRGTVAVTTYETARSITLPEGFTISMLVADEAHYVKNPYALRTLALKNLAERSEHVLYMTGTPIENNVDEMCFLMNMLQPETAKAAENLKYISNAPQFRETISPVYLRRSREDVLKELPEKIEQEQWCRPTAQDLLLYASSVMEKNFMSMRRVSWQGADLSKSSKAQRLLEILELAKNEGRKVIVFSYFRDTAEKVCRLAGENIFGPINGSIPPAKRQEIVDAFTAAPDGAVLVSQVTAGGTGLNIQAASVIVFCEPQIKPSMETQAISRAYRMGQARSVLVYRLLCTGTVDESVVELLREKQEIFDNFAEESVVGAESIAAESMREWMENVIAEQAEMLKEQGL